MTRKKKGMSDSPIKDNKELSHRVTSLSENMVDISVAFDRYRSKCFQAGSEDSIRKTRISCASPSCTVSLYTTKIERHS